MKERLDRLALWFPVGIRLAAALVAVMAATALLGAYLGRPWLSGASYGMGTTRPSAALGLLLLALAAVLGSARAAHRLDPRGWRWLRWTAAAAAALLGGLTLLEYVLGIELGVDIVPAAGPVSPAPYPGRMSIATATAFLLLAGAYLIPQRAHRVGAWTAQGLAAAVFATALLAFAGAFYQAEVFRGLSWYTSGLSLVTAVSLLVLAPTVWLERPRQAMMRLVMAPTAVGSLLRQTGPVVVGAPLLIGVVVAFAQRAGVVGLGFGQALFTVATMVAIAVAVAMGAVRLERIDSHRRAIARELARTNVSLQEEVAKQVRRLGRRTAFLDAILDSAKEQVYAYGPDMRYRFVGPAGARALGMAPEEMVGRHWRELGLPATAMGPLEARIQEVFRTGASVNGELVFPGQDADRVFEYNLTPVRDEHGQVSYVAAIARDVTERSLAEEQEMRLREAAEQNRFKTRFLNNAAHELATPLTPLIMQAHLLRRHHEETGDALSLERIDILQRNLQRLKSLVDDILDAARLQAGRLPTKKQEMRLDDFVAEQVGSFRPWAEEKNIRMTTDIRGPLYCEADPGRIHQLVSNLLSNAVKYTPGGGAIHVEAKMDAQRCTVTITDTGIGFDPALRDRLFQPFSQLHDPQQATASSTGLGLYICHGIVADHGGTIEGHSTGPGEGATFRFTLPKMRPSRRRPGLRGTPHDGTGPGRQEAPLEPGGRDLPRRRPRGLRPGR